jgi:hypothetical protein
MWVEREQTSMYTFLDFPFGVAFFTGLLSSKPDNRSPLLLLYSITGLEDLLEGNCLDFFLLLEHVLNKTRPPECRESKING